MYISDDIKFKIRSIPILEVASALDINVRRKVALCFMHEDKRPSLVFNIAKNSWRCYACDKGGDQITLVMEKLGLNYVDSCLWLADRFNICIPDSDTCRRQLPIKKIIKINDVKHKSKEGFIDLDIVRWIVNNAKLSEIAKSFLFEERKYKEEVVQNLQIGSINDPERLVNALVKIFGKSRALKSGIVRENSYGLYLFFRTPCLLFPYKDINGNIISIQSRYLGIPNKSCRFQFLEGTTTGIFNLPILKNLSINDRLFITEGVTDCIAMLSLGKNAIAIPSATLFHEVDSDYLIAKNLFMYPDKDRAGESLFDKLEGNLRKYGTMVKKLTLPEDCKDFSDYYMKIKLT